MSQQSDGSLSSSAPASVIQQGPSSLNAGAANTAQESSQPHSNGETSSDGGGRQSPTISIPPPLISAKFGHTLAGTGSYNVWNSIAAVMAAVKILTKVFRSSYLCYIMKYLSTR